MTHTMITKHIYSSTGAKHLLTDTKVAFVLFCSNKLEYIYTTGYYAAIKNNI